MKLSRVRGVFKYELLKETTSEVKVHLNMKVHIITSKVGEEVRESGNETQVFRQIHVLFHNVVS